MRIALLEDYLEHDEIYDADYRDQIHAQFLHVTLIEGDFLEVDVANRWCWTEFGPYRGECCYSEYPCCPLQLAMKYEEKVYEHRGLRIVKKHYERAAAHCHWGTWTIEWLGKTDYDHGFGEFCFLNAADKLAFDAQIPMFDWGEHYPWVNEDLHDDQA